MSGNSKEDWLIFEILCGNGINSKPALTDYPAIVSYVPKSSTPSKLDSNCGNTTLSTAHNHAAEHHHHHNIDLVTTLRSELAALSYKKERLTTELADAKATLCSKESECETLRAQAARQSTLISSFQSRLQAAEHREHSVQERCDSTINTIQREKRSADERSKEMQIKIQQLETQLANEEAQKEQLRNQFNDFLRRLSISLSLEGCDSAHLTTDCVLNKTDELVTELQRTKAKVSSTCDTLTSCENELLNVKSLANIEKQRLSAQLEGVSNHEHELESRCRQYERDLEIQRDRLTEADICSEKLKEELRGFESRCHRLQTNLDRVQNDRLQFLRCLANTLNVPEPCETLIKDRTREIMHDNKNMHEQVHTLRDQLSCEHDKLKETQKSTQCRLQDEEAMKCQLEERLEKCHAEIHTLRQDHIGLSEYLQRLAAALQWSECSTPPELGTDTNLMAENLLEIAARLAHFHENHDPHNDRLGHNHHNHHTIHHSRSTNKSSCDHFHHAHTPNSKLRRERSCHDLPLKESTSTVYNLQRKIRVLKEQVQRRDLHMELMKRKLAIVEDGARGRCVVQGERDDAVCRAKKASKSVDRLSGQLADAHAQLAEVRTQLTEAVEYKIQALERARKIDELTTQICDLEEEKTRLMSQVSALKERLKSSSESNQNRRCRDETLINPKTISISCLMQHFSLQSLRDDITHLQSQLSDANHRLSHLQSFRTSVARTLHLRDLPESDLLHRLQALCSAHQEFTLLSKRYETASPVGDHPCPRFDDPVPPSSQCRPPRDELLPPTTLSSSHCKQSRYSLTPLPSPHSPTLSPVRTPLHRPSTAGHAHGHGNHSHGHNHGHNHHDDHHDHDHAHGRAHGRNRGRSHERRHSHHRNYPHRYH